MMLNTAMLKQWAGAIGLLCAAALLTGCSLMDLDRDHCPEGLNVSFAYDYNTQRADMFCDHVGGIEVFVFDENGKLAVEKLHVITFDYANHGYYVLGEKVASAFEDGKKFK